LGLAITKRLIEAMGGELAVESVPGFGSKFTFVLTFPMVDGEENSTGSYLNEAAEISKPHFDKGDILVVDDNNMNLGVVCEHLKRVGLESFIAKDGKEAVESVRRRMGGTEAMFDLIFMDIHMPEMDGKEAAAIINSFNLGVPIVAMTAETIVVTSEAPYKEFGMEGYLGKPFTAQELWKCLLGYFNPADVQAIKTSQTQPEVMNEDEALLQKLKIQFVEGNQNTVEDIANALEEGDINLAHRLAHTLKNSAGLVERITLQQIAADAESQLKNGGSLSDDTLGELRSVMKSVLDELAGGMAASYTL
jgi:CheY-like chemotaxis protein